MNARFPVRAEGYIDRYVIAIHNTEIHILGMKGEGPEAKTITWGVRSGPHRWTLVLNHMRKVWESDCPVLIHSFVWERNASEHLRLW